MVPDSRYSQYLQKRLRHGINFLMKATSYFDIMTNNDTTSSVYWGGMSIFNIRQYDDMD
jgi:hypothetical protein